MSIYQILFLHSSVDGRRPYFSRNDAQGTIVWEGRWAQSPLVFLLKGKSHEVVSPTELWCLLSRKVHSGQLEGAPKFWVKNYFSLSSATAEVGVRKNFMKAARMSYLVYGSWIMKKWTLSLNIIYINSSLSRWLQAKWKKQNKKWYWKKTTTTNYSQEQSRNYLVDEPKGISTRVVVWDARAAIGLAEPWGQAGRGGRAVVP